MKTILVVDDDSDILHLLRTVLEAYGFAVETASNGREAIERVRAAVPDSIFLDLRMPAMNGFETLDIIRREYQDVPIIVITASKTRDIVQQARARGANGCLLKPFDPGELRAILSESLGWTPEGAGRPTP